MSCSGPGTDVVLAADSTLGDFGRVDEAEHAFEGAGDTDTATYRIVQARFESMKKKDANK